MAKKPAKRKSSSRSGDVPIAVPSVDNETLRIRKIDNGYLLCRDGTKKGKYFSHEEFSPTKPVITASTPKVGR